MNVATVISVVFPLLTLITGGACILLTSVVATVRANNNDLKDRVDILEKELTQEKASNVSLSADLGALQRVVTGEVQLNAILALLEAHVKTTVVDHARIEKSIEQVREAMTALGRP